MVGEKGKVRIYKNAGYKELKAASLLPLLGCDGKVHAMPAVRKVFHALQCQNPSSPLYLRSPSTII